MSLYNFFKTRPNEREIPFQTWVQSISLEQFLESALQDNECKFDSKMFLKNKQLWQLAGGFLPEDVNRLKEKYSEADAQQLAFEHLKTFSYVGIVEHFVHGRNIVLKAMDIAIPAEDIKCNETKSPKVSDLSHTVQEMLYELTAMEQPIYDYVLQKTVEEQKLSNKARKFLQFTRPHKRDW